VHRREIYDLIRAENETAAQHPAAIQDVIARLRKQSTARDV